MASRTWVGGSGDDAGNASSWSPGGVPQPGDTLDIQAGTMNIRGNDLAGDALVIGKPNASAAPTTLNLSRHAQVSLATAPTSTDQVTVNVVGADTLNVTTGFPSTGNFTVNLVDHARLTGSFNMIFSSAVVGGGDGARFINGSSLLQGSNVTLGTDVRGSGEFTVRTAQSAGGRLEFGGAVSRGQTIAVSGDPGRGVMSRIQVDHPDTFKAAVALGAFGEVDLIGLTNADSYQLKHDILSIYSGSEVIERLRLTTPPPPSGATYDVTVAQTSAGVVIDRGPFRGTGTVLPLHDASGPCVQP